MDVTRKLSPRNLKSFQSRLLRWFCHHRRDLPWRASRDPYRVWVAEVMLQQTRIAAVIPYCDRFLKRLPDVRALARASEREVLKLWSGLGYYSRARNLQKAAKAIVANHRGQFPHDLESALELPGVGRYTAAAVLSIAYDAAFAVLDGNVARVLARLGAVRGDLRAPRTWRQLQSMADALLAVESSSDWNQGLMELGEVVCTPVNPRCSGCPAARSCRAFLEGLTEEIPAPRKKRAPVTIRIAAAVLCDPQGRTLLVQDPGAHDGVLFSRMWQFPAIEVAQDAQTELAVSIFAYRAASMARPRSPFPPRATASRFATSLFFPSLRAYPNFREFRGLASCCSVASGGCPFRARRAKSPPAARVGI